jgi:stage IV sporulation protein FB
MVPVMPQGLWQIAKWKGVPILLHWSVLLALLWFGYRYQRIAPALLTFFGFLALLLIHELGHAIAARARKVAVFGIRLYLLHGVCSHAMPHRERDHVFIAWGGVLAQAVVLVVAVVVSLILARTSPAAEAALDPLFRVLILGNILMIAINLLPVAPLDGHMAWRVPRSGRSTLSSGFGRGLDALKRSLDFRKRRTMSRDAENKVVDLLERIKQRDKK